MSKTSEKHKQVRINPTNMRMVSEIQKMSKVPLSIPYLVNRGLLAGLNILAKEIKNGQ